MCGTEFKSPYKGYVFSGSAELKETLELSDRVHGVFMATFDVVPIYLRRSLSYYSIRLLTSGEVQDLANQVFQLELDRLRLPQSLDYLDDDQTTAAYRASFV